MSSVRFFMDRADEGLTHTKEDCLRVGSMYVSLGRAVD